MHSSGPFGGPFFVGGGGVVCRTQRTSPGCYYGIQQSSLYRGGVLTSGVAFMNGSIVKSRCQTPEWSVSMQTSYEVLLSITNGPNVLYKYFHTL